MKRITFTFLMILAITMAKTQQNADIQDIRKLYYKTKSDIAYSKKNKFEGKMYCNRLIKNENKRSWRAVGTYHYDIRYWYWDNPLAMLDEGADPINALDMVIVDGEVSARKFYSEYLYSGGNLCFAYYKRDELEVRLYFKDKKLIKQIGKFDNYSSSVDEIKKDAHHYMKTFLASFDIKYN